jgi:25S rRNA (uracil2634-N3)-methyltransferase
MTSVIVGALYFAMLGRKHRHLLKMFFKNARTMLSEIGEIHVTHKENGPYKKWELVKQAEECGLLLKESVHFTITDYPGYTNRRGAGSNAGALSSWEKCRTYKFVLG